MTATSAAFEDDPRFLRRVLDASRLLVLVVDRAARSSTPTVPCA